MEVVIKYKRKRRIFYLTMIVLWLSLIGRVFIFDVKASYTSYSWIFIGTIYTTIYTNSLLKNYLTIKNNEIVENAFFGKRINLNEVVSFKALFGDYILKTNDKELVVNTQIIDHQSLKMLNESLAKYDYFQLE
ncbi:MAG: hypothetical protein RLO12_05975 [Fulvivirga sp.]